MWALLFISRIFVPILYNGRGAFPAFSAAERVPFDENSPKWQLI